MQRETRYKPGTPAFPSLVLSPGSQLHGHTVASYISSLGSATFFPMRASDTSRRLGADPFVFTAIYANKPLLQSVIPET